jgi:hypothetical protein
VKHGSSTLKANLTSDHFLLPPLVPTIIVQVHQQSSTWLQIGLSFLFLYPWSILQSNLRELCKPKSNHVTLLLVTFQWCSPSYSEQNPHAIPGLNNFIKFGPFLSSEPLSFCYSYPILTPLFLLVSVSASLLLSEILSTLPN